MYIHVYCVCLLVQLWNDKEAKQKLSKPNAKVNVVHNYMWYIYVLSAGHVTFSQSDPSNRSHDRLLKSRNAQKSVHYLDNAHLASNLFHCQQGVR